ncbi:hypothetical protein D9M72_642170 [compost metagenome]
MTFGLTLIASVSAAGEAMPAPTVKRNMLATISGTESCPASAAPSSTKAAATLSALERTMSRSSRTREISRLVRKLPSHTPDTRMAR